MEENTREFSNLREGFTGDVERGKNKDEPLFFRAEEKAVTRRGFTLIEMLVYIAILSIATAIALSSVIAFSDSFINFKISRNITTAALTSMERMTRDIRSANSIDTGSSTFDAHPGRLTFLTGEVSTTVVEFYIDNGVLKVKEDGVEIGALTRSEIVVTNLVFRQLDSGISKAVRIEITLESTVGSSVKSNKFYSTVLIRNSVQ